MPYSYHFGKPDAIEWIRKNYTQTDNILDVGPGVGTYSDLLKPYHYQLDALEIYDGYVLAYELESKYNKVYVDSIVNFDVTNYDLVILGDVLEHLTIEDAHSVIDRCKNVLVAVPYNCPQSPVDFWDKGYHLVNPYEEHLQADLTPKTMLLRYPKLELLWSNQLYGYYINS